MQNVDEILALIPHRPPFLWVDRIVSCTGEAIVTEKFIPENLEVLQGHFPGNPIMPGVLLCEAVFQSAALLMAKILENKNYNDRHLPFLTRINGAKFKKAVKPGDTAQIEVKLLETVASACYFKGILKVAGKVAISIDFACKMVLSAG
jgi:3-hydroxyacyl-[acyl-carrier-protein] dehydratase